MSGIPHAAQNGADQVITVDKDQPCLLYTSRKYPLQGHVINKTGVSQEPPGNHSSGGHTAKKLVKSVDRSGLSQGLGHVVVKQQYRRDNKACLLYTSRCV